MEELESFFPVGDSVGRGSICAGDGLGGVRMWFLVAVDIGAVNDRDDDDEVSDEDATEARRDVTIFPASRLLREGGGGLGSNLVLGRTR
jgi:hypothetical protein